MMYISSLMPHLLPLLQDVQNIGARRVCVMTDKNLARLPPLRNVLDSLTRHAVKFDLFDDVRVEPTNGRCVADS